MSASETQRAAWNHEDRKIVIDLMVEEVKRGGRSSGSFKSYSWSRIISGYHRKTGIRYNQKQFKNLWDSLKKTYKIWEKLISHPGVEYDKNTYMIIMDDERWDEYLEANPDAKFFRTKPLQCPKEMAILFTETSATGPLARRPHDDIPPDNCTSSSQSVQGSQFLEGTDSPHTAPSIPTTPMDIIPEDAEEIDPNENMTDGSRKRKIPSYELQAMRDSKGANMRSNLDRLVDAMNRVAPAGPTIEECIDSLNNMVEIAKRDPLYMVAVKSFTNKDYRRVWMKLDDPQLRLDWLNSIRD